jgi:hypothetical protein
VSFSRHIAPAANGGRGMRHEEIAMFLPQLKSIEVNLNRHAGKEGAPDHLATN